MLGALVAVAVAVASPHQATPPVVVSGLSSLTHVASTVAEPDRLYVVGQRGTVRVLIRGKLRAKPFLDISGQITSGGERGLLSIAFHPNYAKNHLFYVNFTDASGDTRVAEYRSDGKIAIPSSRRFVFFEKQPYSNHNGGQIAFGPDRLLYVGMGDGGSRGDPHNNGQTFGTKLAKLWKLNVDRRGAQPQLVAYGLRNPWRFSFDRTTGDLYIGDVGQNAWEEIDYVARADLGRVANFGWAVYEGSATYDRARGLDERGPYVAPIEVYSHSDGCSVSGGFVYRGTAVPALAGRYFYGDYCSGTVWSLKVVAGKATDVRTEAYRLDGLTSFGEDARGGLYAATEQGAVYRIAG